MFLHAETPMLRPMVRFFFFFSSLMRLGDIRACTKNAACVLDVATARSRGFLPFSAKAKSIH